MKCFYHNDMDGRCAASVVAQYEFYKTEKVQNKEDYFEVDYTKPIPDVVSKDELVYIVDYSFTEPTLNQLENILSKTKNVVWCDHHTSTFKLIENHPELDHIVGIRKNNISGAALIYMCLNDVSFDDCPKYIKFVSDYDCWIYKYGDETTFFKLGLESHNFDALDKIWLSLAFDNPYDFRSAVLEEIILKGKAIKSYIDKDNEYYLSHFGYESELAGYKCYVVNKKSNSWIFGDKINQYPFVVVYVFDGKQYSYSLFSTDKTIDCSKIAESFGGGGHSGSAGFVNDKLLLTKI